MNDTCDIKGHLHFETVYKALQSLGSVIANFDHDNLPPDGLASLGYLIWAFSDELEKEYKIMSEEIRVLRSQLKEKNIHNSVVKTDK